MGQYKEVLVKTKKLLKSPKRWTQGATARNSRKDWVDWRDNYAESYCLVGALAKANEEYDRDLVNFMDRVITAATSGYYCAVESFNDSRQTAHGDVLNMLDKAIEIDERSV